jgi:hypothetical protein
LIENIVKLSIPEVDKDLYNVKMNISVQEFAMNQAVGFLKGSPKIAPTSATSLQTSSDSNLLLSSNNKSSLEA